MFLKLFLVITITLLLTFSISCSNVLKDTNSNNNVPKSSVSNSDSEYFNHSVQVNEHEGISTLTTDYYKAAVQEDGSLTFYDTFTGATLLNGPIFNCNYGKHISSNVSPVNSSFELDEDADSVSDDWTCNMTYLTRSDEYANEGKYSLKYDLASSDSITRTSYSSLIQVNDEKIYDISIDSYYFNHVNGTLYAYVVYYNTADASGTPNYTLDHLTPPIYNGKWHNNHLTFIPPFGTLSFRVCLIASANAIAVLYWDNLIINEITNIYQTNGIVNPKITKSGDNISLISVDDTNPDVAVCHEYEINTHSPNIKYTSTLTYKNPVTVDEERYDFTIPSTDGKVMTRDMALVPYNTSKEYYSDHFTPKVIKFDNGVYFVGNDNFQSMSLKLVNGQNRVSYYSDYYPSHPFFLYAKDSGSYLSLATDVSKQRWPKGYSYCRSVTFMIDTRSEPLTLVNSRQPYGYDAAIVFTNHTDQESVSTLNAIFYGTEETTSKDFGSKGLIARSIGITKTVWMSDADKDPNHDLTEADFKAINDKLYIDGVEMCPHSTTPQTETRETVADNLNLYQQHYSSSVWIDHGPSQNNWEDISVAGSIKGDPNYILDLLDRYGYKYAWNGLTNAVPYNDLNMLYPSDTSIRMPLIYYNNNVDNDTSDDKQIYLFSAGTVMLDYNNILAPKNIDKLINENGIHIAHSYLALPSSENYTWFVNEGTGIKEIMPEFDKNLQYIQNKIITGRLWSPTMSEAGDYWKLLPNISVVLNADKTYTVTNNNSDPINGLTLITEKNINSLEVKENIKVDFGDNLGKNKIVISTLKPDESCNLMIKY
jgi:hypothetical protein